MRIDYSKWIITFRGSDGTSISIENHLEGVTLWIYFNSLSDSVPGDDPIQHIKELAKIEIRKHYLKQQLMKLSNKTLQVEDNLDYIENEAERRGLI